MKNVKLKFVLLCILSFSSFAQNHSLISLDDVGSYVTSKIQVITKNTQGIEAENLFEQEFIPSKKEEIKIGYTNDKVIFRFKAEKRQGDQPKAILSFENALSGHVQVYRRKEGRLEYLGDTGSEIAYPKRIIRGMSLAVPLEFKGEDYILVRDSVHRFDTRVRVLFEKDYYKKEGEKRGAYFFYSGAVLSLIIYSLFLFFSTREKNYLFYSLFCFSIFLDVISIVGLLDYAVAPLGIALSFNLIRFSCFACSSAFFFAIRFTQSQECSYWVIKYLKGLIVFCGFIFFASLEPWSYLFGKAYLGFVIDFVVVSGVIAMIYLAIRRFRDGVISAKFYLLSWLFMFIGVFAYMGHYVGLFPRVTFTSHGLMWGNLMEMLVVSLGLAYKINVLDKEKNDAILMAKSKEGYERMARVLIHDLNNPLLLIHHYTNLRFKQPERFREIEEKAWDKIQFSLDKLNQIVEHYKKYEVSIHRSNEELELEEVNLSHAFEEVDTIFEERFISKKIKFKVNLNPNHNVIAERVTFINEVLCNIISNAIKFSYEGGTILVFSETNKGRIVVTIRDEGTGIPNEVISTLKKGEKVFSSPGTHGENGLGFGLSLVQSYVHQYGGELHIFNESRTNRRGTEIKIILQSS